MKSIYLTALLCASLTTPALAETLHYNLLDFNETASVRVPNDTMNVVLQIEESGKSRQEVNNAVTRKINALLARAKAGGSQFEVQSGNRYTQPTRNEKGVITQWTDVAQIHISSQQFNALSKLIADSQAEASIENLSFSVSPAKRSAAVNDASEKVLQVFQQRAQHLSKTLGFTGYKIVRIQFNQSFSNEVEQGESMRFHRAPMAAMSSMKVADVADTSPGVQHIRQSIQVSVQMY